ncbi:NAD(P)/FAD-dependent oxidoreductase [Vibrio coralliilyticus]|uniref:Pyridine nucleotide-disulfide oxidoreductase n=1 Tax=Vibrio coralliilyticus TaxID=190893 RepID=A0AAN0VZV3_9VIBR|nr:ArsO family NAD(P)H-dependent flavin-containing monooxygenase [Vibrio coralliilyticus]AIW20961.1 pyridine nucleotide-disulfide oxidoreductase [Vibrio coralliilyticus]NOH38837.1 NAD(P)/FAD-dependent oxidoreductase [Vibrio coralliilyticus]
MTEQVIIIGAGQAGLSTAYYLKRNGIDPLILDANPTHGGAWLHAWDSLRLFSPKEYSSLSGFMMPKTREAYPSRDEVIDYFGKYEQRYQFRIERPVKVLDVTKVEDIFHITTDSGEFLAKTVVSATGNFSGQFIPTFPGLERFTGDQVHSADYKNNAIFAGKNVAVIGSGNSGSQILAEVSQVANTHWFTNRPIDYLDDELDGRYLFELSTKRYYAAMKGEKLENTDDFSKIVMVDSVKEARERGVLIREEDIESFSEHEIITANKRIAIDAVIWCTGFKTQLNHLKGLLLNTDLQSLTQGTRSTQHSGLWLIGYGEWSGYASATIIGVQKHARETARQIAESFESIAS